MRPTRIPGGRILRWTAGGLAAGTLLVLTAYATVYGISQVALRRAYPDGLARLAVPTGAEAIAEGRRLAQLRGCSGGCHGQEIEGQVFVDDPLLATVVAPNLTAAVRRYSDPELARIIRRGIRPGGLSVVIMPAEMFSPLSDRDLGMILAYLHSVPPHPGPGARVRLGPLARLGLALGKYHTTAWLVHRADSLAGSYPGPGESTAAGAYLARTLCTECHGVDLRGGQPAPDLRIAEAYSPDEFTLLLRTGRALGGRELSLMSRVARSRFSHLTDTEIHDLREYLLARAAAARGQSQRPGSVVVSPSRKAS